MDILNIAIKKGLIKEDQIEAIKNKIKNSGEPPEQVLLENGLTPENILELRGEYFSMPVRTVNPEDITDTILGYLSQESAEHYHFVPIGDKDGVLEVGVTNPDNIEAIDALNFISSKIGMPFKVFLILVYAGFPNTITTPANIPRNNMIRKIVLLEPVLDASEGGSIIVKTGVFSCTLILACSNNWDKLVYTFTARSYSAFRLSPSVRAADWTTFWFRSR